MKILIGIMLLCGLMFIISVSVLKIFDGVCFDVQDIVSITWNGEEYNMSLSDLFALIGIVSMCLMLLTIFLTAFISIVKFMFT